MIQFLNLFQEPPFVIFKEKYDQALAEGQNNIEAIVISSYNKQINQVDSRYVNLKFIDGDQFIFFSNYNSPKSVSFNSHKQISALLYWSSINTQIRMKAKIKKTTNEYNQQYFLNRSKEKNALAISSDQSRQIESYGQVKENYKQSLTNDNLEKCPEYWGGFSFTPYYFEFWKGNEFRLNKREVFEKKREKWKHFILQP